MKNWFLFRLYAAIVEAATGGKTLNDLNNEYKTLWGEMLKFTDPTTKEAKDAKLAVWKKEGEIKAEEARLAKLENDAKIAEARNARLSLNSNQLAAYANLIALRNDKKADPAKVAEAETAFNTAKELVDNELLAKYAGSKPAKKSDSSENGTAETSGGKHKDEILALYRNGKKHGEIEIELNVPRSTVWHTINNAIKAGEVEKLH